jgi:YNFM family putative membrane transporter
MTPSTAPGANATRGTAARLARLAHPRRLVATPGRHRMSAIAATALLFGLFTSGADTILPLWATRDLGWSAADWALLRSLRFAGILVGVVLLGALSDRFGQRRIGALSLVGAAVLTLGFGLLPPRLAWFVMPVYGALVSTGFVNLNTLTQQVSARRQGLANSIYRSVGAGAGIVAPVLATALAGAWGSYSRVFLALALVVAAAAAVLGFHPDDAPSAPLADWRRELAGAWAGYRQVLGQRPLMRYIHLSNLAMNTVAGVSAFAAIYFTHELGQSDQRYGFFASVTGLLVFAANVLGGFFLDHVALRRLSGWLVLLSGASCALMGTLRSPVLFIVGWCVFAPTANLFILPASMWVSRAAGPASLAAVFSVHKILTAAYLAGTMLLLGLLERWLGIRLILLGGGLLGMLSAWALFRLPEPPPASERSRGPGTAQTRHS